MKTKPSIWVIRRLLWITFNFLILSYSFFSIYFFHSSVTTGPPHRRLRPTDGGDSAGRENPLPLRLQRYGCNGRLQVISFNSAQKYSQQECIPVGCIQPARNRTGGSPRTDTPHGQRPPTWTETHHGKYLVFIIGLKWCKHQLIHVVKSITILTLGIPSKFAQTDSNVWFL